MADAAFLRSSEAIELTVASAVQAGELRQLADGRAAYLKKASGAAAADANVKFTTVDQVTIPKTTGMCFLDGGKVFWDYSASKGHYKAVDDQDFYAGTAVGDAALNDTTMTVNLNVHPHYNVDVSRDSFITAIVGTQALGGLGLLRRGGAHNFTLDATNEAQKLDILSKNGFATAANAIVEFAFTVPSDGAGTVVDVNVGVANTTHATDADSITRYLFMHLDANATAIRFQSTDGTTTVASADSTATYAEGQTAAVRKEVWFDFRNPADVQVYVDAVNVLPATVFNVSLSAATWLLLAHIEKSASTDTYSFDLEWLRQRTARQ